MDPYGAPPLLHEWPHVSRLYDPVTMNGNWYERRCLAEDLAKHKIKVDEESKLDMDRRNWILMQSNQEYMEVGHQDEGQLFYGDAVHIQSVGMVPPASKNTTDCECPSLVIDMSKVDDNGIALAYGNISETRPKGRSTFYIKHQNEITYPRKIRRVCYGDPLYLISVVDWQGLEWRLTSSPEYSYNLDTVARKQTVWLYPLPAKKSLWNFQCLDRNMRPIMEGEPVDTRQSVVIMHVLTGRSLTVNFFKRFKTMYGIEYLMTCDRDVTLDKMEKSNAIFNLKPASFSPWKLDQDKELEFREKLESQIGQAEKDLSKKETTESGDSFFNTKLTSENGYQLPYDGVICGPDGQVVQGSDPYAEASFSPRNNYARQEAGGDYGHCPKSSATKRVRFTE